MDPELHPDPYVFTSVSRVPADADPAAMVREQEGTSLVVDLAQADRLGLSYDYVAAWITLRVHSALDSVGLTAAISLKLAEAGISCNVVAGYHHDHLFVPHHRGEEALRLLAELASGSVPG